jgi:thiamine biosynthesis lipoprotein
MYDATAITFSRDAGQWTGRFVAMACPCEVLIEAVPEALAQQIVDAVAASAWRVERKFSRYRTNSAVHRINESCGRPVLVDAETANLLDFAATLTKLSDGAFDITSGVLRKAWTFDGGDHVPSQREIEALLEFVGWDKATWRSPTFTLPAGMQIDFGGIGKEYAVDSAAVLVETIAPGVSCVINFGGDMAARNPRRDGIPWRIGIESADHSGSARQIVELLRGGIATSGDSRRFVYRDGQHYSHILDARTGWPVPNAPRSITVAADTCTQAGTLTTLAMLQGECAEALLMASGAQYWLQ